LTSNTPAIPNRIAFESADKGCGAVNVAVNGAVH
jgi:hypothetical protein